MESCDTNSHATFVYKVLKMNLIIFCFVTFIPGRGGLYYMRSCPLNMKSSALQGNIKVMSLSMDQRDSLDSAFLQN